MHSSSSINFFKLSPTLLLWGLIVLSLPPQTRASALHHPHPTPQLPLQLPQQLFHSSNAKSWLSRARDTLIHTVWRIPTDTSLTKASGKASAAAGPPPTLLARYGGDLVLRFDINSIHDAEALAQAVDVLFLDVWEFTTDWVDIRLSKDIVCSNLPTLGYQDSDESLHPAGAIVVGTSTAIPAACSHSPYA